MRKYNLSRDDVLSECGQNGHKKTLKYLRTELTQFEAYFEKLEALQRKIKGFDGFDNSVYTDDENDILDAILDQEIGIRGTEINDIYRHIKLISHGPTTMRSVLGAMDPAAYDEL